MGSDERKLPVLRRTQGPRPEPAIRRTVSWQGPKRGNRERKIQVTVALQVHCVDVGEVRAYREALAELPLNAQTTLIRLRVLVVFGVQDWLRSEEWIRC